MLNWHDMKSLQSLQKQRKVVEKRYMADDMGEFKVQKNVKQHIWSD